MGTTALTAILAAATVIGLPPAALAVPGDPPPPLFLDEVGSARTLSFPGATGEMSLSLPIPGDLVPVALRGVTESPAFVGGGTIDVVQGDRILSRTPIDPAPNAPIELPLNGIETEGAAADLRILTRLNVDNTCVINPDNAFRIIDTQVEYAGREAIPQTVADFLPPVLRQLTLYIPDDVRQEEGAAAVSLAAAITAHYGSAHPRIVTASLPRASMTPPTAPGPLERQIVISTDRPAGLGIGPGPEGSTFLTIGGAADQLATQSTLLVSDLAQIAVASAAVAGPQPAVAQLAPTVRTLSDIGVGDTTVVSTGWPEITIGIDQTRLGRPATGVRVELAGSYTPTGSGVIAVRAGERTIATIPTDDSGSFDTFVDIPDDVLRRYTGVTVTLENAEAPAGCLDGPRSSLSLSSAGEIVSTTADPPPAGFVSLPQALLPWTQLAWTTGDVADVARAVSIVTALQQLSAMPLDISVVDMATAASSALPAILIAADGTGLPDPALPVTSDGSTITVRASDGSDQQLSLTPQLSYGALQVIRDGDRTLLIADSTGSPGDLDQLLARMSADGLWSSADGEAVLQVAGREPVVVDVDVDAAEIAMTEESSTGIGPIVVGALAAAGLLLVAALLFLRRRRRPTADATPATGTGTASNTTDTDTTGTDETTTGP
ncbi:hypothetical protein [Millisia brevis]|uniref:hypothetical protein n=1 Tax=Millisia brevis TaxID=264148 RepID=UPI001FDF0BAA|nr:hypothetical protein [Millisia brevis]